MTYICGLGFSNMTRYCMFLQALLRGPGTNGSGFLVSYCWLLRYRGRPPKASGTDPLVALLLQVATVALCQALGMPEYSKCMPYYRITAQRASKVLSSVS